jgi:hypothetical protein
MIRTTAASRKTTRALTRLAILAVRENLFTPRLLLKWGLENNFTKQVAILFQRIREGIPQNNDKTIIFSNK